jgi:hypothetical protein
MPRYKRQLKMKKNSPWTMLPLWGRVAVIVLGMLLVIGIATMVSKRMVSHLPPVYGGAVADQLLTRGALIKKVIALQTTVTSYDAQLAVLSQLQHENDALKAELGRTPAAKGIVAHVLTLPNRSFYDTMMIDGGSAEGIKVGSGVYAFDSVAIGTVSAVDTHSATVLLYSAPNRQTSGTAVGSDVAVTLIGRGAGEYEVQLPRDLPFSVGGMIAQQSTTPATLAQIEKIATDPRDPFQRLLAKAPVNLQALKWVIVR